MMATILKPFTEEQARKKCWPCWMCQRLGYAGEVRCYSCEKAFPHSKPSKFKLRKESKDGPSTDTATASN